MSEMAACIFGASGLNFSKLDLSSIRPKLSTSLAFHGLRISKVIHSDGMIISQRAKKATVVCISLKPEADLSIKLEDDSKGPDSSDAVNTLIPKPLEVESLLTVLCDTTSISEVDLKLGGFRLHVRRNLTEQGLHPQPSSPATVVAQSIPEPASTNGLVPSPSLALTKPKLFADGAQSLLEKAGDEGLVILRSPRVGSFRRSRTIKGKRAPPSCQEKDIVKEGQALCFIEQLGGEIPVETETPGEVVKILKEDGDPVGYGDALLAVLPSFPGIGKVH